MNGHLRFYTVEYSHNEFRHSLKPHNETATEIELEDLNSFTEYNITVYAYTTSQSQPSQVTRVRTAISGIYKPYLSTLFRTVYWSKNLE